MTEPKFPDEIWLVLESDGSVTTCYNAKVAKDISDAEGLPFRRYILAESEIDPTKTIYPKDYKQEA